MDYIDIRSSIIKHINVIQDLLNVCVIDKLALKLSSTKDFWVKQFINHNLPMCNKKYDQYNKWRNKFLHCKLCLYKSVDCINTILFYTYHDLPIKNTSLYRYYKIIHQYNYVGKISSSKFNIENGKLAPCDSSEGFVKYGQNKTINIDHIHIFKMSAKKFYFRLFIDSKYDIDKYGFFEFVMNDDELINIFYYFYSINHLNIIIH